MFSPPLRPVKQSAVQREPERLRLVDLIRALSHAQDLVGTHRAGHGARCCWIGMCIGGELSLGAREMWELYYSLMLKNLGCGSTHMPTSVAEEGHRHYLVDCSVVAREHRRRQRALTRKASKRRSKTQQEAVQYVANDRAGSEPLYFHSARIARTLRFPESIVESLQFLHELRANPGRPIVLSSRSAPLYARIALLAQRVEAAHRVDPTLVCGQYLSGLDGEWFDNVVVDAFRRAAANPALWDVLGGDEIHAAVLALEPGRHEITLDDDYLDDIAAAFGQMVDAKSPYTCGHSARVAIYSERIAAVLGLPVARQQWIKRAAFLHDIGKLGVDSQVLDKPGKLDAAEWTAVKTHAAYTEEILSGISAFAELAKVAGAHHEKLDGSGYPRGLKGDEICIEARIITVADIFDAITAARPYRTAITPARAIEMMEESAGTQLDSRCVAALKKSVRLRDRGGCAASTISA